MRIIEDIPFNRFEEAYTRAGWTRKNSADGRYGVWIKPDDPDVWTMLPTDISSPEYRLYQNKNLLMLLYALGIEENEETISELVSQLKHFNYKLINRIVPQSDASYNSVPYELATLLPDKNIDAFRYFYQTKAKRQKNIPIERFEMNHTEVGSFIIPVSISVDENDKQVSLASVQTDTNKVLHDYLSAVQTLTELPRHDADVFAKRALEEQLNSKIVKDFYGSENSVARYKEKYQKQVKEITIGSTGSYILDFGLTKEEKDFKQVDIGGISALSSDFIETLERLEIASDSTKIEEFGATLNVLVDSVNIRGTVVFEVLKINNDNVEKPFKAISSQLTKSQLDKCADYFKERKPASVLADITKPKGRMGKITIESINPGKMISSENYKLDI